MHLELSLVLRIWSIYISYSDGGDNGDNDAARGDVNDGDMRILGSFFLSHKTKS